jgi:hypothetical protein
LPIAWIDFTSSANPYVISTAVLHIFNLTPINSMFMKWKVACSFTCQFELRSFVLSAACEDARSNVLPGFSSSRAKAKASNLGWNTARTLPISHLIVIKSRAVFEDATCGLCGS